MPAFVESFKDVNFASFDDAQAKLTEALKKAYKTTATKTEPTKPTTKPTTTAVAEPTTDKDALVRAIAACAKAGDNDAVLALAKMLG